MDVNINRPVSLLHQQDPAISAQCLFKLVSVERATSSGGYVYVQK